MTGNSNDKVSPDPKSVFFVPVNTTCANFCRVCRCEGTVSKPLFHPCLCTGSIKYIHQDCLVRWLEYSKRNTCELCNHRFAFTRIYASGTPRFLPLTVLAVGLANSLRRFVLNWIHLSIVFTAWLVVVPLSACRMYRCLFTGSVFSLLTLPLDMVSTKHLLQDCVQGFIIVILALAAFLGYVSLREQLLQGTPAWLERDVHAEARGADPPRPAAGANGRRPLFPDIFNIFGVANGGGLGAAVFGEGNEDPVEPELLNNDEQPHQTVQQELVNPEHIRCYSLNQQQPVINSGISESLESSHESADTVNRGSSYNPQQLAWYMENTGANLDGDIPDEDGRANNDPADADGAPEAMNWKHLLGLDGSLNFLEHVLWLIALNTLFIVIFAFCPYHMGQFTVLGFNLERFINATHMEGFSTSLIGYIIFAFALILMHEIFTILNMPRACYWTGLGYIYIKVALLSLMELGIFPILSGFWIDACTLSLFNATLTQRASVFHYAPVAFTFIHWAIGMLYIFYMASLLVLGRSVLRPGVLRFIYHFNDPDYKPIQDMILQPLPLYIQRLIAIYSVWGILIVLMLWLPTEVIRHFFPNFLPFRISAAYESPLDYSLEMILLQVVLPFLLDNQAKTSLRQIVRWWCLCVSWLLGLRSYLLGDIPFSPGDFIVTENGTEVPYKQRRNTHAQTSNLNSHSGSMSIESSQRILPNELDDISTDLYAPNLSSSSSSYGQITSINNPFREQSQLEHNEQNNDNHANADYDNDDDTDFTRYIPYKRGNFFKLRITGLILILITSLICLSLTVLILPVGIGRLLLLKLSGTGSTSKHDVIALVGGFTVLGIILRLAPCIPHLFSGIPRIVMLIGQSGSLISWSRPLRVFRIWTRLGTTCEITIRRPALPMAPMIDLNRRYGFQSTVHTNIGIYLQNYLRIIINWLRLFCIAVICLGILPTALGLLINFIFIVPFRIGPKKTIIIGFWEHWIFGIMHLKVVILLTLLGPPWWLRNRLELFHEEITHHRQDARCMRLLWAIAPLLVTIGLSLSVPYLLAYYISPLIASDSEVAFRYIYPFLFALFICSVLLTLCIDQIRRLYLHIKDEKYLVGKQLLNFRPSSPSQSLVPTSS
uniref:RING-type E3 ubiquitin transferase n=1 Tax=Schistosoma mansoni TaxID=6183 RepID=A0A5K4F402_SCHMA